MGLRSHDHVTSAKATTGSHSSTGSQRRNQESFSPTVELDIDPHLLVRDIENIRTEDLVHDIHSGLDIIADAARYHVPCAVACSRGIGRMKRAR
jgi:hypothetical protein